MRGGGIIQMERRKASWSGGGQPPPRLSITPDPTDSKGQPGVLSVGTLVPAVEIFHLNLGGDGLSLLHDRRALTPMCGADRRDPY